MNTDDPNFTAYALGELDSERSLEMEHLLAADAAAAGEAAALRQFAGRLRKELHSEKAPALTDNQRARVLTFARSAPHATEIECEGAAPASGGESLRAKWRYWIPAALAAGIVVYLGLFLHPAKRPEKLPALLAQNEPRLEVDNPLVERPSGQSADPAAKPAQQDQSPAQQTAQETRGGLSQRPGDEAAKDIAFNKPGANYAKAGELRSRSFGAPMLQEDQKMEPSPELPAAPPHEPLSAASAKPELALAKQLNGTERNMATDGAARDAVALLAKRTASKETALGLDTRTGDAPQADFLYLMPDGLPPENLGRKAVAGTKDAASMEKRGRNLQFDKGVEAADAAPAPQGEIAPAPSAAPSAASAVQPPAKPAVITTPLPTRGAVNLANAETAPQTYGEKSFARNDELRSWASDEQTAAFVETSRHPVVAFTLGAYIQSARGEDRYTIAAAPAAQLLNSFQYNYSPPQKGALSVALEAGACPWAPEHRLVLLAIRARDAAPGEALQLVVAAGVRAQVRFNPDRISEYRSIDRTPIPAPESSNAMGSSAPAGAMKAGQAVTTVFEVAETAMPAPESGVLARSGGSTGGRSDAPIDSKSKLKAGRELAGPTAGAQEHLMDVTVYWKDPRGSASHSLEYSLDDSGATWSETSSEFRWAASVANYALSLGNPQAGAASEAARRLVEESRGAEVNSSRDSFLRRIQQIPAKP